MAKDTTFNIRVDKNDMKRLKIVAASFGCSMATAIRMLIKAKSDSIAAELVK